MLILPLTPQQITANKATFPVSNLLDARPGVVYAAVTSAGDIIIDIVLSSAVRIDGLGLLFSNATASATWEVRGASSAANLNIAGSILLPFGPFWASSDITRTRRHSFAYFTAAPQFQYWRLTLRDATNPEGVLRIGRLVMGSAVLPNLYWDAEGAWSVEDYGLKRDLNGPQDIEPGAIARVRELRYSMASRSEITNVFRPLFEVIGITRDLLFIETPEPVQGRERSMIYGTLVDAGSTELRASNVGEIRLKIKERL
jgi:hypothetical protein